MTKETERALLIVAGLYALSKYSWEVVPALERAGARVYDVLHDDTGHKQDLPGKQLTRQALLALATAARFPDPKLAAAIALAESGGVTGAIARSSREYSVGLWQINTIVHPYSVAAMKNPINNATAAYQISRGGTDWRPWTTFTSGAYRNYLTGVLA
jgi:hypothetical protein